MTRLLRFVTNLPRGLAFIAALALPVLAQGGGVPMPVVPEANARFSETQGCVEPTEEMRKNHMEYILHQRDETMHRGIRTRQYALEECINCHVPENSTVRHDSPEHFCNSCHIYAAVTIDCFQCHADRPVPESKSSSLSSTHPPAHRGTLQADSGETLLMLSPEGEPLR
jgi:hypothetical protein